MMSAPFKKYFTISLAAHVVLLLILVISIEFASPMVVVENTDKHDVISAVVLGDIEKSKILPQKNQPKPKPIEPVAKEEPKPEPPKPKEAAKQQPPAPTPPAPDAIALKIQDKKKLAEKALQEKLQKDIFGKDLLADIKKVSDKQKKQKQKELQAKFEKTLREQAEKTMRQQLLNEDIKMQGAQARLSQGVVDKYRALIIQSISEHWIVPPQVNKKLFTKLTIRLAPGGTVLEVHISKSSGDPSLDSSARAAVMKASPLPVPKEAGEFEPFREFELKVKPENVISS